jgi:23S rRNA (cytosine1962-C5)-methyltransferase
MLPNIQYTAFRNTNNPLYRLWKTGDKTKWEIWGDSLLLKRPEPQALWQAPSSQPGLDKTLPQIVYHDEKGWQNKAAVTNKYQNLPWVCLGHTYYFAFYLSGSKHVGIFPEQSVHWEWLSQQPSCIKVLNLFAYTGCASVVLAKQHQMVTHVDASNASIEWGKKNALYNRVDNIQWIVEDVLRFLYRQIRRGILYQGIVLDPPHFGRGAKGEMWRIEEQMVELLVLVSQVIDWKNFQFLLLTIYATSITTTMLEQYIVATIGGRLPPQAIIEIGEIITTPEHGYAISGGISVRITNPVV